jgi:glutamyl-tRNA reductase
VCCTGALGTVLAADDVRDAMGARPRRPMVVLDLALPHDSDPEIGHLPRVARVDLAMLADRPEARADRDDVVAAERVVGAELEAYATSRAARAVEPILLGLRARGSAVAEAELRRIKEKLVGLDAEQWALVEQALRRTVNTLMHTPTVRIKELASDPDGQRYADALSSLFDLSLGQVEQVIRPRDPRQGEPG